MLSIAPMVMMILPPCLASDCTIIVGIGFTKVEFFPAAYVNLFRGLHHFSHFLPIDLQYVMDFPGT